MENKHYYHLCADGEDAHNFIISEDDFIAAINLVGVCAANTEVEVICFSIEDSHPHFLLYGQYKDCLKFKNMFEVSFLSHVIKTRGSKDNLILDIEIIGISDEPYLMNVATYIVVQPTKDGKDIMPFDYRWGSACLYFRRGYFTLPWCYGSDGTVSKPMKVGDLGVNERRSLLHSRKNVPEDWLACNGILLPSNYVNVRRFESIYRTCNCYRTFLSSGKSKDEPILKKMADARGVALEDLEARNICREKCAAMFGVKDVRRLSSIQRADLARELRAKFHMSFRQLSVVVRLPESEIRKYVH